MKKETLLKRAAAAIEGGKCTTCKKTSIAYKLVKDIANGAKVVATCHTSGSGRFTKNLDYTADLVSILNACNIKYEITNIAPRGGKCGQRVIIKTPIA